MKGVILAGGTGSRLHPLTRLMNKHLRPGGKYPMVCYGIDRLRRGGITDVLLVISKQSAGLYTDFLGSGAAFGVSLTYKIQEAAGGIAEALELAAQDCGLVVCTRSGEDVILLRGRERVTVPVHRVVPLAVHGPLVEFDGKLFTAAVAPPCVERQSFA